MASGVDMLLKSIVKLLNLEPEIEKVKGMIAAGEIEKAFNLIRDFERWKGDVNDRLTGIERKLGIERPHIYTASDVRGSSATIIEHEAEPGGHAAGLKAVS